LGRAVLVTGASRGIGAAVASAFASAGDRVAVHYGASADRAHDVAASLPGDGHVVVGADLSDPDAVRVMVDEAAARLGGLDVLVNNAGVFEPHPITETSYEEWQRAWQRTLAVNLVGAANVTWCAVQHMVERGGGRIVNVASGAAYLPGSRSTAYSASKAAVHRFSETLAGQLEPHGIPVFSISPGLVRTELIGDNFGDDAPWTPPELAPRLVRALAGGRLDALSGRYLHAEHDDIDDVASRADEIVASDLNAIRLRR
jgi:NAD(P)-dependent dehydrogenase (short-subunit alcohol dehydrogenase family)